MKVTNLELGTAFLFGSPEDPAANEGTLRKFSPSGKYCNVSGRWFNVDHINVLEVLSGISKHESDWEVNTWKRKQ